MFTHASNQVKLNEVALDKSAARFQSNRDGDENDGEDDGANIGDGEDDDDDDNVEAAKLKPNRYLRSQENNKSKKHRRSHLQSSKGGRGRDPSIVVSNSFDHCDRKQRVCTDCFGIEKKTEFQSVDRDLVMVRKQAVI